MTRTAERASGARVGGTLMAVDGIGMMGYAVWFIVVNFTHLIEIGLSPAEVGKSGLEILAFSPGVYHYVSHLQVNLGAFIAATGLAVALMGWYGVRQGQHWAWFGVLLASGLWAVVGLPIHYVYGLGTVAHVGPAFLGLVLIAIGGYAARPGR